MAEAKDKLKRKNKDMAISIHIDREAIENHVSLSQLRNLMLWRFGENKRPPVAPKWVRLAVSMDLNFVLLSRLHRDFCSTNFASCTLIFAT
jgi:hypothetical protein